METGGKINDLFLFCKDKDCLLFGNDMGLETEPRPPRKRSMSESSWQKYLDQEDADDAAIVEKVHAKALEILKRIKTFKKELVTASTDKPPAIKMAALIPLLDGNNNNQTLSKTTQIKPGPRTSKKKNPLYCVEYESDDETYIKKYKLNTNFPKFHMKRVDSLQKIDSPIKLTNISAYTTDKVARSFQQIIQKASHKPDDELSKKPPKSASKPAKQPNKSLLVDSVLERIKFESIDGSFTHELMSDRPMTSSSVPSVSSADQVTSKSSRPFTIPTSKLPPGSLANIQPVKTFDIKSECLPIDLNLIPWSLEFK